MWICPTCNRKFEIELEITKHSLGCWKKHNPNHKSKPAPRSENITTREVKSDIMDFLSNLKKEKAQ